MRPRALSLAVLFPFALQGAATIVIVNGDDVGVGFNDSTSVAPVGGNSGTTLGQQRMVAFQAAADKWASTLDSSVTIRVLATWTPLTCNSNSGVVGSAGPSSVWRDFAGTGVSGHWYPKALANKLAGEDMEAGLEDIDANFNVNIGQPGCLDGLTFYLGLDGNKGDGIDLVAVLEHELAHGLGFQTATNKQSGAFLNNAPSIADDFLTDNTTGKTWTQMSRTERANSSVSGGHLVWGGGNVTFALPQVLRGSGSGFSGADPFGRALMYSPILYQPGSSVAHWDPSMTPNQLMEPVYNTDLTHAVAPPIDLTLPFLQDIGWINATPQLPQLNISNTRMGSFTQGQTGTYRISVRNAGNGSTNGSVTVSATLPSGITAATLSGTGWSCGLDGATCSRFDSLAAGSTYPDIVLGVDIAPNAPLQVSDSMQVWGGGSLPATTSESLTITASTGGDGNPSVGSAAKILPQLAFGGGWYTALYFTNTGTSTISFPVNFFSDNGASLALPSLGATSKTVTLGPRGTAIIEAPNVGGLFQGWASMALPNEVVGYGVFRQSVAGVGDQEAVAPLSSGTATSSTLIWDDTSFITAAAIVNPSSVATTVTITVRDIDGSVIGTYALPLAANNKVAKSLRDLPGMSGMLGRRGSADFTVSSGNVAVLGLRFGGSAFTSIPTTDH